MTTHRSGQGTTQGSLLLEVAVAMMILAVGLLAETQVRLWHLSQRHEAGQRGTAVMLAQWEVRVAYTVPVVPGVTRTTYRVGAETFTVTRTVTGSDPAPNADRIHVSVAWGGQQYETETVFADGNR